MENLDAVKHLLFVGTFFAVVALDLVLVRLAKPLHVTGMDQLTRGMKACIVLVLVLMIAFSSWGMTLNPIWNGQMESQRDQYEKFTESLLRGHLYFDNVPVDEKLLEMENPYDPDAREALQVRYAWDHAYYNGHYYLYYGVAPVFLLFAPYRLITGRSLTGFHATQVFVAALFCGVFCLFRLLTKKFFKNMSVAAWLFLTVTVSLTCIWSGIAAPALYNTAVSSALCMEVWSLFFYVKAVWDTGMEEENKAIRFAFLGALFGALAFGCRPNIALGNLLAIPLVVVFLKQRGLRPALLGKLLIAVLPYVVIGILLMLYNRVRFDNPFEFGQSYQLTIADQSDYGTRGLSALHWVTLSNGLIFNFFQSPQLTHGFPFVGAGGVFLAYPVFCYAFFGAVDGKTRGLVKENRLGFFLVMLAVVAVLITAVGVTWAPYMVDRYREDVIWLIGILAFLCAGLRLQTVANPVEGSRWICRWCIWSLAVGFMLCADMALTGM